MGINFSKNEEKIQIRISDNYGRAPTKSMTVYGIDRYELFGRIKSYLEAVKTAQNAGHKILLEVEP